MLCPRYFQLGHLQECLLSGLGAKTSELVFEDTIDETLDALADHIEKHLDVEKILALAAEINSP